MTSSNSTIKKIGVAGALTASMVTGMAGGVYADATPVDNTQDAGTQAEQTVENVKHVKPSTKAEAKTALDKSNEKLNQKKADKDTAEKLIMIL